MATRLTKKQQGELAEELAGIVQKNNALQLRLSADRSVNEMNVNQISSALNRIHGQAIGKELPTEINIPVKQLGSGDPSPDNIRPIVGYTIDGIGTVYGGELNIDTGVLTSSYAIVDMGDLGWLKQTAGSAYFFATITAKKNTIPNRILSDKYLCINNNASNLANAIMLLTSDNAVISSASTSQPYVYIRCDSYAEENATALKQALAGAMLVYELETPETYTLTPEQMIQLLDQL